MPRRRSKPKGHYSVCLVLPCGWVGVRVRVGVCAHHPCPSNISRRIWRINFKLGLWIGLGIPQKPIVFRPPRINIKLIIAKTITQKDLGVAIPILAGHLCCQHTILVVYVLTHFNTLVFIVSVVVLVLLFTLNCRY